MPAKNITGTMFAWIRQILLIVFLTFVISILIIQTYDINDVSMQPTFDPQGNRVLVFLTPYLFQAEPDYGEIVIIDSRVETGRTFRDRILENPLVAIFSRSENDHLWVKRVIALPGDSLEFEQGRVYRNGNALDERYIRGITQSATDAVVVPPDHVFVMGDNRSRSSDSRQIGPVPLSNIQGRVIMRIYPLDKIRFY